MQTVLLPLQISTDVQNSPTTAKGEEAFKVVKRAFGKTSKRSEKARVRTHTGKVTFPNGETYAVILQRNGGNDGPVHVIIIDKELQSSSLFWSDWYKTVIAK